MIRSILHAILTLIAFLIPHALFGDSQTALRICHDKGYLLINTDNASPIQFDMEGDLLVFEYNSQKYSSTDGNFMDIIELEWEKRDMVVDAAQTWIIELGYHKIVGELPEWIEVVHNQIRVSENNSGQMREADILMGIDGFGGYHKYHVIQLPQRVICNEIQTDRDLYIDGTMWVQPQGDILNIKYLEGYTPKISNINIYDKNGNIAIEKSGITVKINEDQNSICINFPENKGSRREMNLALIFPIIEQGYKTYTFIQAEAGLPSLEEQKKALEELYKSTNGPKWKNNGNWLSDKNLGYWYGVGYSGKYMTYLNLGDNNICGELPNNAIRTLIQLPKNLPSQNFDLYLPGLDISSNGLYGRLSDELQAMPQWQTHGISILMQAPYYAEQRRFTNYKRNIKIPDYEIEYLFDESYSTLYPLISNHRLNHVMIYNPSEYRCNQQLSYPDNFQTIVAHQYWMGNDHETTVRNNKDFKFKNVVRLWNCIGHELHLNLVGTTALIDNDGYLVDIFPKDWDIPESWEDEMIDGYLREYLGEPKEHDWFTLEPGYTSTDYSQDGQWIQLQAATEGNGVNVVFIGDGFVDKDMDRYEEIMREGMEHLFSIEPLRSLRNRFNVYVVKVVSPNDYTMESGKQTLNRDYNTISEYVTKIPGVNFTTTHTCLIENKNNLFFVSGYTDMFADGGSVAVIDQGLSSNIIIHEVGGHGIGKLIDEYILAGYEENHTQPGAEESFKQWIANDYHAQGWGMNISAESEPDKVPWARMLTDDYFGAETGIFMGAWMWPQELWRPSENSVMNTDYSRFNAPSREAIYKWVMKMSEGDSWQYDFDTFKAFDRVAMSKPQAMPQKAAASDGSTQKRRHRKAELPARIELRDGKYVRVPIPMP